MHFTENDLVFQLFKKALADHEFVVSDITEDELVCIVKGDFELTVSPDNLRKEFAHENDENVVMEFAAAIASAGEEIPTWEVAKDKVFPSFFPSDYDYGEFVNFSVTEMFNTVFVYEEKLSKKWIDEGQVDKWGIDSETLVRHANENLDRTFEEAELEIELIEGRKLVFLETVEETKKAVFLLSKRLKDKVSEELGWPIYAVIPVRDFLYLFSEKDSEFFIERVGGVVI
ncbi:MAG: hypothetical protein GXC73_15330, partial [Chitinophagaceae bacterium]|nr:hypothetical protein [Chitinophagaceae bacterium]